LEKQAKFIIINPIFKTKLFSIINNLISTSQKQFTNSTSIKIQTQFLTYIIIIYNSRLKTREHTKMQKTKPKMTQNVKINHNKGAGLNEGNGGNARIASSTVQRWWKAKRSGWHAAMEMLLTKWRRRYATIKWFRVFNPTKSYFLG